MTSLRRRDLLIGGLGAGLAARPVRAQDDVGIDTAP